MATKKESSLPMIEKFNVGNATSAGPRWIQYVERFQMMLEAFEIESDKRRKALLLHSAGEEIFQIYSSFTNKDALKYNEVTQQISEYFTPRKCVEFEVYKFRTLRQKEEETIDEFYARLRNSSTHCDFHDRDLEIKMQIIQKCSSDRLRKKALQQSMDLKELLSFARSLEISEKQAKEMSYSEEHVDAIKKKLNSSSENSNEQKKCFRCGMNWPHKDRRCPAYGTKCTKCGKFNHLREVCKSKTYVSCIENEESEESEESECI